MLTLLAAQAAADTSLPACNDLCMEKSACKSFTYSRDTRSCTLAETGCDAGRPAAGSVSGVKRLATPSEGEAAVRGGLLECEDEDYWNQLDGHACVNSDGDRTGTVLPGQLVRGFRPDFDVVYDGTREQCMLLCISSIFGDLSSDEKVSCGGNYFVTHKGNGICYMYSLCPYVEPNHRDSSVRFCGST